MSRQLRYRMTAVALGGLLLGAPLMTNATANATASATASAGQSEGDPELVFGGGLGRSCLAEPDVDSMIVPAERAVNVVNRTGHPAQLLVEGVDRGTLPDGGVTRVALQRSTTVVSLDPDCPHDGPQTPALLMSDPSDTDPSDTDPSGSDPSDLMRAEPFTESPEPDPALDPSWPAAGVLLASLAPAASPSPTVSDTPTAAPSSAAEPQPSPSSAQAGKDASVPLDGGSRRAKVKDVGGTAGARAPRPARKSHAHGVPLKGLSVTKATTAPPAPATTQVAAGERVGVRPKRPPEQPIGLLAAVALVCAAGVGCAAIRAFAVQRAYRAKIA